MVVKEDVFDFSDFDFSGLVQGDLYKNAISAASSRFDYWAYCEEFTKAVDLAKSSGETGHAEAFRILAWTCSMVLCPDRPQNPFRPMMVDPEGRRLLPEDLSEGKISFLSVLVGVIDDFFIKARLAELLWLVEKPKSQKRALLAIDSYLKLPLSPKYWVLVRGLWTRAIVLSTSLREVSKIELIRDKFLGVLLSGEDLDSCFLVGVARVLRKGRLYAERTVDVAEKLELIASTAIDRGSKRDALEEAAEWFGLGKLPDRKASCDACVVDIHAEEAEDCLGKDGGAFWARDRLEAAIKKCRDISRKYRSVLGIENKLAKLRERQREAGVSVVEGMREVCISSDVTASVEKVKRAVSAKDVLSALTLFVNDNAFPGVNKIKDQTASAMKDDPLRWMFQGNLFSIDGRLVAEHSPVSSYDKNDQDFERAYVEQFRLYVDYHAQAFIYPALLTIRNEHWLNVDDFEYLARRSSIVPGGREKMWAIGLHAGYEGDFVVALHVLVPQIEHMVRVHLKEAGVSTSTLGPDMVETENGLSTLVQCPEAVKVFGEDLLFELKYLLCSPLYANIRNEMAHGLLGYELCDSTSALYFWWLVLRLMLSRWWNCLAVNRQSELLASMVNRGCESDC